ncbi:MAG: 30S ribosomal protein S6 [Firmicutes bacterium]|nr:30S ribosomal protein S6 [Bacillota bacterium]NLO66143.1 30S ribosomal protein S6 [Bacillota bacterium]
MRHYELMVIYASRLDEEGLQAQIERTKELIASVGGEVDKVDVWGKRRFAYEINDNTDGFYVVIDFQAESGATSEVERILKITDEVVRYLLVRKEKNEE